MLSSLLGVGVEWGVFPSHVWMFGVWSVCMAVLWGFQVLDHDATALDFFNLVFPGEAWELLERNTNLYAFYKRTKDWTDTTVAELKAFIGTPSFPTPPPFGFFYLLRYMPSLPVVRSCLSLVPSSLILFPLRPRASSSAGSLTWCSRLSPFHGAQ